MTTTRPLRPHKGPPAPSRFSGRARRDVALLHFHIAYRTWRCGLPVDWEHAARRMAEALGWDGESREDDR